MIIAALSARKPGSSPLTRGKPLSFSLLGFGGRLIPAHAGKTDEVYTLIKDGVGSSPLTRGKP